MNLQRTFQFVTPSKNWLRLSGTGMPPVRKNVMKVSRTQYLRIFGSELFTVETMLQEITGIAFPEKPFLSSMKILRFTDKVSYIIRCGSPIMRKHENNLLKAKSIPWLLGSLLFDSQWKIVRRKLFFLQNLNSFQNPLRAS